jgi:hypothetical protein
VGLKSLATPPTTGVGKDAGWMGGRNPFTLLMEMQTSTTTLEKKFGGFLRI